MKVSSKCLSGLNHDAYENMMTEVIMLCQQIASEISSIENRERKRSADAQKKFEHAIECLLKDLWFGTAIHPEMDSIVLFAIGVNFLVYSQF